MGVPTSDVGYTIATTRRETTKVQKNMWWHWGGDPLHVSSNTLLIIRKSNCINTASGIVFSVSDRPVCRLRRNFLLNLNTGWSLTENTIPDAVLIQFDLLIMSTDLLETCRGL